MNSGGQVGGHILGAVQQRIERIEKDSCVGEAKQACRDATPAELVERLQKDLEYTSQRSQELCSMLEREHVQRAKLERKIYALEQVLRAYLPC